MQHIAGHAGAMQDIHRARGDQRRLLRRLGDDRVARSQCRTHLAAEDRQWEIPRADAGKDAAAHELKLIALAGRAGKAQRLGEIGAPARGVVAQEIHGFA